MERKLKEIKENLKIIHLGKKSKIGPHENETDAIITTPQCPVTAKSGDSVSCVRVNSLSAAISFVAENFQSVKRDTTKILWLNLYEIEYTDGY